MSFSPRILVLRGGALVDFVATLPVFAALRERWPEAHVEVAGYPHIAVLALDGGLIDAVRSLDDGAFARLFAYKGVLPDEFVRYLRSFDIVFTFLHDPDGLLDGHLRDVGVKQVISRSPLLGSSLHACDYFLKGLESLAIYAEGALPVLARTRMEEAGRVVLHPGCWPLGRYFDVAERLRVGGAKVTFLLGDGEEGLCEEVAGSSFDFLRDLSLSEVVGCLSSASLYVGGDSGFSHVASALGLKALLLFGAGDVDLWEPRGRAVKVLRGAGGEVEAISVQEVVAELEGFGL